MILIAMLAIGVLASQINMSLGCGCEEEEPSMCDMMSEMDGCPDTYPPCGGMATPAPMVPGMPGLPGGIPGLPGGIPGLPGGLGLPGLGLRLLGRAAGRRLMRPVRTAFIQAFLGPQLTQLLANPMGALTNPNPREYSSYEFPALQGTPEIPSLFPAQGQMPMLDYMNLVKFLNQKD